MIDLKGKIALVSGASRGIGKAIALTLGNAGATVIGTATSDAGAEAISNYMSEAGMNGRGAKLNVTETDSITETLKAITEEFGAPTILVNNAGITKDNLMLRMKEEEWDNVMDTNLKSVFSLSKAVLRGMMKAKGGRIINITSVVGASGNPGQANYCASKAGVIGFTKSLGQEVATRGITVNAVAPGFIATDMTEALNEDQKASIYQSIPAGRMGKPEEIASAVAFLASDEASYITGTTMHVNGGMYMA
ncbi:MAG: 3-oxoacyl-ACP reductase FabG [Arenicella sp.]